MTTSISSISDNDGDALESSMLAIYSVQRTYYTLLKISLISAGYESRIYSDRGTVMKILEYCIGFYIDKFENWCIQNIRNSKDIGKIK